MPMIRLALSAALAVLPDTPFMSGNGGHPVLSTRPGTVAQDSARAILAELLRVLDTGDQTAYEGYVARRWSPVALKEYPVEDHASSLARIFTDTRGFVLERIAGAAPGWIQARARGRLTRLAYCLTLARDSLGHTDFTTRDIHPAGPGLRTPASAEIVREVGRIAGKLDSVGELSGVLLIAKDDRVLFQRAYGKASIAYDTPMRVDSRLSTASIGKSFTALAVAHLVEAGRLRFEDTVGAILPDYPDSVVRTRVIVLQLLTHTAGLGEHYDHPRWPIVRSRLRSVPDYLQLVIGRPMVAEPGTRYEYSNSAYILMGALIEKLTGRSFYDYVQDHVFRPARMTHTTYPSNDEETPGSVTSLTNFMDRGETGYIWRMGPPRNASAQHASRGGPQGGAASTVDDLLALDVAFRSGKLVSPAMVKRMTMLHGPSVRGRRGAQPETVPGLGFEITTRNGHRMIGHQGGDLGVASWVYHFPETGYTMIGMTNRDPRAARVLLATFRGLVTRRTLGDATPPSQEWVPPVRLFPFHAPPVLRCPRIQRIHLECPAEGRIRLFPALGPRKGLAQPGVGAPDVWIELHHDLGEAQCRVRIPQFHSSPDQLVQVVPALVIL